jgi:hypothetical protein
LQSLLGKASQRPFDLARDLMLRATLFRLGPSEYVLLVVTHHVASDGWSVGVFCRDLGELYDARRAERQPRLPELTSQYRDFAAWQRRRLQGDQLEREIAYWRAQLAGAPTLLELPTDRPRPSRPSFQASSYRVTMPRETASELLRLCRDADVTPYAALLSGFAALLYRVTGQDDLLISGPFANRTRGEFDDVVGLFANTMVIRARLSGNPTFEELLQRVTSTVVEALEHQEFPFERVVEALRPSRHVGINPLAQVNFRVRVDPPPTLALGDADVQNVPFDLGFAAFDLAVDWQVVGDAVSAEYIYDAALFEQATIARLAARYEALLTQVLARPDARLLSLDLPGDGRSDADPAAGGSGIRRFREAQKVGLPAETIRRRPE